MNVDKIPFGNCTLLIIGKEEISDSFKHWCLYVNKIIKLMHTVCSRWNPGHSHAVFEMGDQKYKLYKLNT